jgi:hypothetical protein
LFLECARKLGGHSYWRLECAAVLAVT